MDPPDLPSNQTAKLPLKRKAHTTNLHQLWKQYRDNRNLWDVVLKCDGDVTVHADATNLAAWSAYFEKRFTGCYKDSDNKEVVLEGICGRSLETIIEGLYSNCIVLCRSDVADVLYTADRLQFVQIVERCEEFMANDIDNETATLFYTLANKHSLQTLKQIAEKYIQDHLPYVVQNESGGLHFVALGSECILHFLATCNSKWRRGVRLLHLLEVLSHTGVSHQQLMDCIDVEHSSAEQLNEIQLHPVVQEAGSRQFFNRIAATALKHMQYLTYINPPDFLPNVGLHLENGEHKVAVCWHVRNWAEKSKEEAGLYSPEFVIPGKGSWKLQLYPNGCGSGSGSHISVFIEKSGSNLEAIELTFGVCMLNCSDGSRLSEVKFGPITHSFPAFDAARLGWGNFMPSDKLAKESDIWVQNDTIILVVTYKP